MKKYFGELKIPKKFLREIPIKNSLSLKKNLEFFMSSP